MLSSICPKCHVTLKLKASVKIKASDWIRCPLCGERFHPQPTDLGLFDEPGPTADSAAPKPRLASQKFVQSLAKDISKAYDRKELGESDSLSQLPAVLARPDRSRFAQIAVGSLVGCALLISLAIGFTNAAPPPAFEPPPKASPAQDYATAFLASDLRAMKDKMIKTPLSQETIDFRGSESRFYKHFAAQLGDGYCQDFSALRVYSDNTHKGFKAIGICLSDRTPAAELTVDWSKNQAKISLANDEDGEDGGERFLKSVDLPS